MQTVEDWLTQLVEAWHTNNRINLFLIDHIDAKGMKCTLSKRGGRNVVRQFTHIHNVRVWHLEKRAKALSTGLVKFGTDDEPSKPKLKKALNQSCDRVTTYFEEIVHGTAKHRGFKKGVIPNLGYFIAHESHHRGSILLTLKECGHNLDQATRYAIWPWDHI